MIEMVGESVVPHVERGGAPVFADVVAADLDWVRAEFDEIVAANFLDSSAPPLRRQPRRPRERARHPAPPIPPATWFGQESGDLAGTARRTGARERSPPRPALTAVDARHDTSNGT
ncbi:hypothetical protein [Lentzea sp. NPDC004782]|uniref:hypothetical protein n=1 Tax=Lentzea sp. NPDC004782 TaxID=3154458 RepID=UPI0033B36D5F